MGPVKNQHVNGSACGCCWTFATTGVVECIVAMATGKPISLSEQQLIDCDRAGDKGAKLVPGVVALLADKGSKFVQQVVALLPRLLHAILST